MNNGNHTLPKSERLHSKKLIDSLFCGGNKSMSAFPLRMVLMPMAKQNDNDPNLMLVSVPKRLLHRANRRNLVKRQIREAYRKNKHITNGLHAAMAFVWLDKKTWPTDIVEQRIVNLLTRAKEKQINDGK